MPWRNLDKMVGEYIFTFNTGILLVGIGVISEVFLGPSSGVRQKFVISVVGIMVNTEVLVEVNPGKFKFAERLVDVVGVNVSFIYGVETEG